ncbi:MAG: ubiquinone biosynthesis hydroxylase [Proteobacteria bacterium]|nr:ubiquinone biosynthesis hydroxylase [Pseudomonadota bacterium]
MPNSQGNGPGNAQAKRVDLVIGGAGFAGLALAIALREALGERFAVTVADPALAQTPSKDPRSTAIAAAARRLFEAIDVWDPVADGAQPILDMVVTDSKLSDAVRPTFLTFGGEVEEGEPFAHMVENRHLIDALVDRAKAMGIDLRATAVSRFDTAPSSVTAVLADGSEIRAKLLVGADGARSAIREHAGIASHGWSYDQSGIVTTIAHERPHNGCAEEHFLPAGPFAILPLTGNRVSIVWTESTREADRIVALPDDEFLAELERRFGLHLGDLTIAGPRRAFPLGLYTARSFIGERLALIGDAAHVIHPIAGQGLNMGLRDVAALAEAIADAARLGLDIGSAQVLERYQRWRRFDTMTMGVATDGLNKLFSNHSDILRLARDVGLGMVERMPALKKVFIREAAGVTGDVPKLMKGEMV